YAAAPARARGMGRLVAADAQLEQSAALEDDLLHRHFTHDLANDFTPYRHLADDFPDDFALATVEDERPRSAIVVGDEELELRPVAGRHDDGLLATAVALEQLHL